jgi:anti-sigma factor RsiW
VRSIDIRNLIDLYLDDELPVELASEFMQAMHEDDDLAEEVAARRKMRDLLREAFEKDEMTDEQYARVKWAVRQRALELGYSWRRWHGPQMELPLNQDQPQLLSG